MERVFTTLLDERTLSLGIRSLTFDIFVNPRRDPGCLRESDSFLRHFCRQYDHALVAFDHHGCGSVLSTSEEITDLVCAKLSGSGWGDRADVVVIVPELEAWVWSESPHVEEAFGWAGPPSARQWLHDQGFWPAGDSKPPQPKAAAEHLLRATKKRSPSAVFRDIAAKVSLERCTDPSFLRLRSTLQRWFPPGAARWTSSTLVT